MTERDGFATLRAGGLDWDALPLRLWRKGNALFWNAADIDLTQEADGWRTLSGPDVEAASRSARCFWPARRL